MARATCAVLLCMWVITGAAATTDKLRSVLILLADDMGFELGAYGNAVCQTPHLDALARRSLLFNYAFTSVSSCSPSRAALLTGTASHASGMYGLHHGVHHFAAFDHLANLSLPNLLRIHHVYTGIIGKKHVGPADVFRFDFEQTEENNPINQVGRNITYIKLLVRQFLQQAADKPFLLVVSFHDPHRCAHSPHLGAFCERFGSGQTGTGTIPDWTPWYYQWDEVPLTYFQPDTEAARRDIAAQYTTISRLDQGVGLVMAELEAAGRERDALVVFTSDNGVPFPAGRTNLYDSGVRVPLLISSPLPSARRNEASAALVSLLDLHPTALDWLRIPPPPSTTEDGGEDNETAPPDRPTSLLPILEKEPVPSAEAAVFLSQSLHEVTMYYPMRAIRTRRYKLIHNINYAAPFPIDQDLYVSPTFQDILNRSRSAQPLPWYTSLARYYARPEWQLFDLRKDPEELHNLHGSVSVRATEAALARRLQAWLRRSRDPWRCAPHAVLRPATTAAPGAPTAPGDDECGELLTAPPAPAAPHHWRPRDRLTALDDILYT